MKKEFYSSRSFPLLLSLIEKGVALFAEPLTASFSFHYNIRTKEGQAQLVYLNKSTLAIRLYPTLENMRLIFISKMQPTPYTLLGTSIVLNKVILKVDLKNNIQEAALVFNYSGDLIYTTANYNEIDSIKA